MRILYVCLTLSSFAQEQVRILNHDLAPRTLVKVLAFAGITYRVRRYICDYVLFPLGTGKTSTLVEYAKRRPGMRFLFACFNK